MGRKWDLDDIAGNGDLAAALGVSPPTVANWPKRYPDFPKPLVVKAAGPVYSLRQVRKWHDSREWKPGKH